MNVVVLLCLGLLLKTFVWLYILWFNSFKTCVAMKIFIYLLSIHKLKFYLLNNIGTKLGFNENIIGANNVCPLKWSLANDILLPFPFLRKLHLQKKTLQRTLLCLKLKRKTQKKQSSFIFSMLNVNEHVYLDIVFSFTFLH